MTGLFQQWLRAIFPQGVISDKVSTISSLIRERERERKITLEIIASFVPKSIFSEPPCICFFYESDIILSKDIYILSF